MGDSAGCKLATVILFISAYGSQFAFYGIDIYDALREVSGRDTLALRTKALWIFDQAQLYRVGRMIQEIVKLSVLPLSRYTS